MIDEFPSNKTEILIVDDNPHNIRLLSKIMTNQGYLVRKALRGEMALKSVYASPPDLVLLDINMPEMDGYEVCQRIKTDPQVEKIPIIFLSAFNKPEDKVKAFQLGCVDYITKPFQVEEVVVRIKNQLTIKRQQEELIINNQNLTAEIEKRKQVEVQLLSAIQELERLSIIDSLTKVANRRRFDQYLETQWHQMKREKMSLSLLLCDIDYFKYYNDRYGHPAGDDCLARIAQILIFCIKRSNDLLARYGGEEFAVVLPNTDIHGALQVAKDMCSAVEEGQIVHEASKINPYITLSVGVASCIPSDHYSIAQLISQADQALYKSKQQGRNRVSVAHI